MEWQVFVSTNSCIRIPKDEIVIPKKLLEHGEIVDYVKGTLGNLELLSKSCDDVCDPVIDVPYDEPCVVESVTADKPTIAEIPAKDTSTMSQTS